MPELRRVLVVSDEMEVGGSQRQIVNLLRGLDRNRWQAELVYFRERSFLVEDIEVAGIVTRCIHKSRGIDPGFLLRLHRCLRSGRYELVHCFSLTAELWIRALLPWLPHITFVTSIRGLFLVYAPWQWRMKRWILGRCDLAIANTHAGARETAARTGFPQDRIAVIPNGVALPASIAIDAYAHGRIELGLPAHRVVALFVGRLVAEKNLPLLLTAMTDMTPAQRPLLLLAGSGPLEGELRARITDAGLDDDVRLLGERRDTTRLMQLADLLVLPSLEEGLSNVLLEAMAVGCAVLASDVGGNPEVIETERTGLLFPSDNRQSLVAALARLCGDVALRRSLGEAALHEVRARYAIPAMVMATEKAWTRALDGRH
jgi:glycosyltransferase involved in cell wall biosynthesis